MTNYLRIKSLNINKREIETLKINVLMYPFLSMSYRLHSVLMTSILSIGDSFPSKWVSFFIFSPDVSFTYILAIVSKAQIFPFNRVLSIVLKLLASFQCSACFLGGSKAFFDFLWFHIPDHIKPNCLQLAWVMLFAM